MKKKILSLLMSVYLVSLLPEGTCNARLTEIRKDSIYSDILKETRPLNIVLPIDFNASSSDKYELLFCLDGISDLLRMELDFLQGEGFVPKNLIMAGIPNTERNGVDMRNLNFTPTHTSTVSGGADKFLSFFRNELIPYFIKRYNAKMSG